MHNTDQICTCEECWQDENGSKNEFFNMFTVARIILSRNNWQGLMLQQSVKQAEHEIHWSMVGHPHQWMNMCNFVSNSVLPFLNIWINSHSTE